MTQGINIYTMIPAIINAHKGACYPMESKQKAQLTGSVRAVISEALQVPAEQVTADLAFGDLPQWDSMGHMEVMMSLEAQFGVEITADTIASLTSIPAICGYLDGGDNGRD